MLAALRPVLRRHVRFDRLYVDLEHLLLYVVDLLLYMIQPIIVGVAAIFGSLPDQFLSCLPSLHTVDLIQNIGAKYLHLACFGRHAHVRARLTSSIGAFRAVIIIRAAEHLDNFSSGSGSII